jgi:hypothetical protein
VVCTETDSTHIKHGKFGEDRSELLVKRVLRKLDFPHIEIANTADLEVLVDYLYTKTSIKSRYRDCVQAARTVGVFLWVLDRTMSRKSLAVGTGAICFRPLVDILFDDNLDTVVGGRSVATVQADFKPRIHQTKKSGTG